MINLTNGIAKKTKKVKFNPIMESIVFSDETSPSIIKLQNPTKSNLEKEPAEDSYESFSEDDLFDMEYSSEDILIENIRRLRKAHINFEQIQERLNELDKVNAKWQNYKYDYYSKYPLN